MPSKQNSATPKASLTLSKVGPGFNQKNVAATGTATLKTCKDNLLASLSFNDKSARDVRKLQDVVANIDYKLFDGATFNSKYEFGPQKFTVGYTFSGRVQDRAATVKTWYSSKEHMASGEATVALDKKGAHKANVTFNTSKVSTAKYALASGPWLVEPSYNFDKKAPTLAVTKKLKADTLKVAYDIKSENASLEYNRKPLKLTMSTTVAKNKLNFGLPTVSATFEKVYEF